VKESLNTSGIADNKEQLDERLKELKLYEKTLRDDTKEGLSIFNFIKSQIESIKNGKTMHLCAPTFDLIRCITSLCVFIAVLNLILAIFFAFWRYSLLITFGLATIGISEWFDLKWSKKRSFITGAIVASIILFFIPSKGTSSQSDDSQSTEEVLFESTNDIKPEATSDDSDISELESKYDFIYDADDNDGWRKVELNGKKGFIDENGKEVVPPKYDYIYDADDDNGWRKVELDGKKGFIDKNGKEIVPPEYDYIYDWSGGLLKVEKKDKTGYINREGKLVQPLE
jgi:hypothetical protein